jgi:hypothetical protein
MSIHHFGSTGEAYDACQCDDDINFGDTLVIESEKVVGLAWVWPVAITEEKGELHGLNPGASVETMTNSDKSRVFSDEAIKAARETLAALNF